MPKESMIAPVLLNEVGFKYVSVFEGILYRRRNYLKDLGGS